MSTYNTGDKISLKGTIKEVIKNEAIGSRYRIAVKTCKKLTLLYMEADEFSGGDDIDDAVTVPAKIEKIVDDEVTGVTLQVKIKANDALSHLNIFDTEVSDYTPDPEPEPEPEPTPTLAVTVEAEDPSVDMFGTLVSDMQDDVVVANNAITGILKYLESGALVDRWGAGYFIGLRFIAEDWSGFESVKVGLDPSYGDGLVEIKDDADHDGAWKITDIIEQKFVVEVDGERISEYDLSGLILQ